ncbi:MAG: TetR/AcrR family transcriptional regulator [Myxococcota bacterium]
MPGRPSILSQSLIRRTAIEAVTVKDRVTFRRIAERLGVSSQALYKYYPNVEALQVDVAQELLSRFNWRETMQTSGGDVVSLFVGFGLGYRDWVEETGFNPETLIPRTPGATISNDEMRTFQAEVMKEFQERTHASGIEPGKVATGVKLLFGHLFYGQALTLSNVSPEQEDLYKIGLEAIAVWVQTR